MQQGEGAKHGTFSCLICSLLFLSLLNPSLYQNHPPSDYSRVPALTPTLFRSRVCLDLLVQLLLSRDRVSGEDIRQVVEGAAVQADLDRRAAEAGMALL